MEIHTDPSRLKPLIIGTKVFRSSDDFEISNEDAELALKELNETEEVRNTCLRDLRKTLSRHGVNCRMDDAYLLRFLRCTKFKCKEAYEKIRYLCSLRRENPEIFNSLPCNFEELLNLNLFIYLPYRDEEGSIMFVDKFGKWDHRKLTTYDLLQIFQPIADVIFFNPSCQINKIIAIMDFKDTDIGMFSPALTSVKFWTKALQNMNPWRIKYVFLLNCNSVVYMILKFVRHLLKKKIADRMVIIGSDMRELHKYINPAILPKEYGGNLEESECCITKHILNNLPYIKYEQSFYNKS